MFFPFLNYRKLAFDVDSNGTTTIYTAPYDAWILIQVDNGDIGDGGSWRIFTDTSPADAPPKVFAEANNAVYGDDYMRAWAHFVRSGDVIEITRNDESVDGFIHEFRLPV